MSRPHGRHDGHTRPRPWRRPARDAEIADGIAHVQRICPGWLVMWSPWRQSYTAFSMATREAVVLDDANVTGIIQQILYAEAHMSIGHSIRAGVPA